MFDKKIWLTTSVPEITKMLYVKLINSERIQHFQYGARYEQCTGLKKGLANYFIKLKDHFVNHRMYIISVS